MTSPCVYKQAKDLLKSIKRLMVVNVNHRLAAAAIRRVVKQERDSYDPEIQLTMTEYLDDEYIKVFRPVLNHALNDKTIQELNGLRRYLSGEFNHQ